MASHRDPDAIPVALGAFLGAAGMTAHNVVEFGVGFVIDPQTLIPVAIFGLFAVLAWTRSSAAVLWVFLAWASLNLVVGGILSVLPLGLFPFQPDQSLGHYGAHVVYSVAELALILALVRALRGRKRAAHPVDMS